MQREPTTGTMRSGVAAPAVETRSFRLSDAMSVLLAMIAVSITLNIVILPFAQVADPVSRSFGRDDLQFSLLLGAFFAVPSTLMSVAGGWLADRCSRRRLMLVAMMVWTAGAIWTALATSYEQLALARMVVAAAAGTKFPLAMTWVSDAFPPHRRAKAIGGLFVVLNVGPAISASLGGLGHHAAESGALAWLPLIGTLEPWRAAMLLLAAANLLPLPWVASLNDVRPAPGEGSTTAPDSLSAVSTPEPAAFPVLLSATLIGGAALLALADTANLGWLPTVLKRQYGFDTRQTGFTFGVIATVAGIAGPVLAGVLDDRLHARHGIVASLVTCSLASAICAPMLAAFASTDARWLVGCLLVSGVLSVMAMTVAYVAIQALMPAGRRGMGTGVAHAMTNLASAAAPTLVAGVAKLLPEGPSNLGMGVAAVTVSTFAAAAALYAIAAWQVRKRRDRFA